MNSGKIDQKDCFCLWYNRIDVEHVRNVEIFNCPEWKNARLMPIWCIPILWFAAISCAILLNRFVEGQCESI